LNPSDVRTVRCLVAGHVQGVWYRATASREAERLGLDGWVRNLPDGSVEAVAAGPPTVVAEFCRWLWTGPPGATVEGVIVEECEDAVPVGFSVR